MPRLPVHAETIRGPIGSWEDPHRESGPALEESRRAAADLGGVTVDFSDPRDQQPDIRAARAETTEGQTSYRPAWFGLVAHSGAGSGAPGIGLRL